MSSNEEGTKHTSRPAAEEEMPGAISGSKNDPDAAKEGAETEIMDGQRALLVASAEDISKSGAQEQDTASSSMAGAHQLKDAQRALLAAPDATSHSLAQDGNQQDETLLDKQQQEPRQDHSTPTSHDDNDGDVMLPRPLPQPLPDMTTTTTNGTRNTAVTTPGAYAGDGRGPPQLRANLSRRVIDRLHYSLPADGGDEERPSNNARPAVDSLNQHGLVQANPVSEEEEAQRRRNLPRAQKQEDALSARDFQKKKTAAWAIIAALVVLVLVVVVVVVVLLQSDSSNVTPITVSSESPSAVPSAAPSAAWLLDFLLSDTLEAILEDPDSYQAQAYEWLSNDPNRSSYSLARLEQRFALACIYYATQQVDGDVVWERSDGWLEYDNHECDWLSRGGFGFESFPDRESLTQALIDFNGFLRSGNRTAFIEWEAKLLILDAGQTCNEEGLYTNLFLYKNNLVGTVPNEVFTYLTNLKSVDLSWNFGLGGTISSDIGRLTNLEFLWLGYNAFTGELPLELADLSSLQIMHIVNTQVTGPIPSEIGRMTDLVFLSFATSLLSSSVPEELSKLVYLINLDLAKSQLTGTIPSSLGRISGLKTFRLFDSQVSGSIPTELGGLQQLDIFDLSNCQLSSSIPSELGLLSNTPYLNLQENQLTGSLPSELGRMEALVELLVYDNSLSGSLPVELYGLEKLTALQVHDNLLMAGPIDSSELVWNGMSSLEIFTLTNTSLSGELPQSLCNASSLELSFNCSDILCGCNCTCS